MIGIGWRHPHYAESLARRPAMGFLEVHSENFFVEGGATLAMLEQARSHYPISLHGVGLGLGSALGLDETHLRQLSQLVERTEPLRVSDHASFARTHWRAQSVHASDLLPIPFTATALDVMCRNVQQVQERLRRPIAVENLSAYVQHLAGHAAFWPSHSEDSQEDWAQAQAELKQAVMSEVEFLLALTRRTGCQLLVDLNNLYVNALNVQKRAMQGGQSRGVEGGKERDVDLALALETCMQWVRRVPVHLVAELHLAGHCDLGEIVIDDHGSRVSDPVWSLLRQALAHWSAESGDALPDVLIEWDTDLPSFDVLLQEAQTAQRLVDAQTVRIQQKQEVEA